ncbi:hypothetical protein [Pontivivens ytuae]|uniref:Uncharacterized protein n=1 Tax=Pontivivens ytuae TaxID=2789856 RepID=A0A7S9QDE3_9RHOB|nr:hypothetical protein [Pontivivens ytuae]QPH54036.1 hypothetical protein I0K15_20065 [Pontivivens ytuae]
MSPRFSHVLAVFLLAPLPFAAQVSPAPRVDVLVEAMRANDCRIDEPGIGALLSSGQMGEREFQITAFVLTDLGLATVDEATRVATLSAPLCTSDAPLTGEVRARLRVEALSPEDGVALIESAMAREGCKILIPQSEQFVDTASAGAREELGLPQEIGAENVRMLNYVLSEGMERLALDGRLTETGDVITLSECPR